LSDHLPPESVITIDRNTQQLDRYRHVLPDGRLAQSEVGMPI
jgi:hypothetical protein